MKAMVLHKQEEIEKHPLNFQKVETPKPLPNEIRIEIEACGVCHTDLHEIEGDLPLIISPLIPGHEIVGRVEKLGKNVKSLTIGDKVGTTWLYSACRKCKYCLKGKENLCPEAKYTGYSVNGGYAEFICVPESYVFKIPEIFETMHAAPLMCAGVIGMRSLKLSEIQPKERLGLFGFGASAHICIQIANYWDCETYVFTRSENHQKHAKELGAKWVGTSKDEPPVKLDSAITFAPVGTVAHDALQKLDKGGTLAINAIYLSDIPSISWDALYYERKITSVAHTTRQDAKDFLDIARKIPVQTKITPYKLENANQALEDMKNSKINGAAVLKIA